MRKINIAGREVSDFTAPLVIAEIGINHEGSIIIAKEMVDQAFKSGAEIIKYRHM